MRRRRGGRLRGLGAIVVLAVVVAGPPIALVTFVGWPLPRALPGLDEVATAARSGIDDQVVVKALAVLAWLVWAQIALAAVVEMAGLLRGRVAGRAPVVAGLQLAVGRLVGSCALVVGTMSTPRAAPAPMMTLVTAVAPPAPQPGPAPAPPPSPVPAGAVVAVVADPLPAAGTSTYVVQRNDSWWAIAEQRLGDGQLWQELRRLNLDRPMTDGTVIDTATEVIRPGWKLLVPAGEGESEGDGPGESAELGEVVVRRGDNLWSITENHMSPNGDAVVSEAEVRGQWAKVIELNRARLVDPADPDLIYPGQVILVPGRGDADPAPAVVGPTTETPGPTEVAPDADPQPAPTSVAPSPLAKPERAPVVSSPTPAPPTRPLPIQPTSPTRPTAAARTNADKPTPAPDRTRAAASDKQGRQAVPLGLLGTAGTMVAVGVAAALNRRRRRRQLDLPPRAEAPAPPAELDDLRREVALRDDTDSADRLHRALRDVARALAEARSSARPRLVQITSGRIEVLLSQPVSTAPSPWRAEASGAAWSLSGQPRDPDPTGPAPAPVLVAIGRPDPSTELYLDLEAEGVVCLVGDPRAAADTARSWLVELAYSPTAAGASVVVVGDCLGVLPDSERLRGVATWGAIALDVAAWAEQSQALTQANGWPTTFAGRAGSTHSDGLGPLVVFVEKPPGESIDALCAEIVDSEVAVVLVVLGGEVTGATTVVVGEAGLAIPELGLVCEAQVVGIEVAEQVEDLLEDAAHLPAQLSFLPERPRPAPVKVGDVGDDYHDPPFEVLVQLLGDISVVGGARKLKPQETAVVAYIALYGPVASDRIEDAVWVAPTASRRKRLANTVSACRSALGSANLPLAVDGRYRLGPKATTDLELFERRLAYAAGQDDDAAAATLRGALELVTGPVFTTRKAERGSFVWVEVENCISTWELMVTDTAEDLVARYLALGDFDGAVWAARRGLDACKIHDRLTKALMQAHLAKGDAEASRRVFESHQAAMEQLDLDDGAAGLVDWYQAAASDRRGFGTG